MDSVIHPLNNRARSILLHSLELVLGNPRNWLHSLHTLGEVDTARVIDISREYHRQGRKCQKKM